jgi:hypothetical protein
MAVMMNFQQMEMVVVQAVKNTDSQYLGNRRSVQRHKISSCQLPRPQKAEQQVQPSIPGL